ncbi:hypothetical protein G3N59_29730 [Paraburkholderia sp. Ac-20340]|nr:hypothetical protein [Paraburkholderia sp. Ac-20340]
MDALKAQPPCPREALGVLTDLAAAAFAAAGAAAQAKARGIDVEDLEQLVGALRLLSPQRAEFGFFEGWLRMLREEWDEAEWLFRDLAARGVCLPSSKGMLLQCLKARGSFGWQDEARELAREHADDEVGRLARTLLAAGDLQDAARDAARTGRFVPPDSALELETDAHDRATARLDTAPRLALELPLELQYLRI